MWSFLRLCRWPDSSIAFIGTFIGARLGGLDLLSAPVLALASSNALLSCASMMFNDWHDVAEDSINRPQKPIPAGLVQRSPVLVGACLAFAAGILLAGFAHPPLGLLACVVTAASVGYTLRLKGVPLVGNVLVSLLSSYSLWCWAWVLPRLDPVYLWLCVTCFVFGSGREIARTGEDLVGDAHCGIKTVATTWGISAANRIGAMLMFLGLVLTWIPVFQARTNGVYNLALATSTVLGGCCLIWVVSVSGCEQWTTCRLVWVARIITALMALGFALGVVPHPHYRTPFG